MNSDHVIGIAVVTTVVVALIGTAVFAIMQPVMESKTYNKLTGAHTTWWDALWVELRVQDQPLKP